MPNLTQRSSGTFLLVLVFLLLPSMASAQAAITGVVKDNSGGGLPGVKGLSLCEQIRAADARTPIVIFSGNGYASDIEAGMLAGANAYLVKPDSSELIPTIRHLLEAAAG